LIFIVFLPEKSKKRNDSYIKNKNKNPPSLMEKGLGDEVTTTKKHIRTSNFRFSGDLKGS
jgi:hypothetical protein